MTNASDIASEVQSEARAILDWWRRHAVDRAHGGFYGEIDAFNRSQPGAAKGLVLNARILWFMSEAARQLGDADARALAARAADEILKRFHDREHGGVYWSLDAQGAPLKRKKQAYALAFALYALCAYARMSDDARALPFACALFELLETKFRDAAHGGYLEAFTQDWRLADDMRLSALDANSPKSANTHLHVLEAYTALHETAPSAASAAALRASITLFLDRIIDPRTRHLRLFFARDWTDCSQTISFGHDIEAAWLVWSACETLGEPALSERARPLVLAVSETCLREALDSEGGLANEQSLRGARDARRVWWAQAEAMVGFLNAYLLAGEAAYFEAFARVWDFIKRHHRDHARGEWLWWSRLDTPDDDRTYKAGFWKGPYHNGRAMLETLARLNLLSETERKTGLGTPR
jgi:cellobiose epimerase